MAKPTELFVVIEGENTNYLRVGVYAPFVLSRPKAPSSQTGVIRIFVISQAGAISNGSTA